MTQQPCHDLPTLFQQLGLPSAEEDIARFVATHRPLAPGVVLSEASFWTPAQSDFLCTGIADDAEWAEVVDRLSQMLR
ncbi:DUF2789 domain-containing protein [Ideonella azotifigens]|uniref:DUF2789 domain-containing protein n=1 Tax=Ideonella azotifigens TaxID=513160 RepID=A0ABN1JIY0_9BURK|nr:DUF2789 family protein [Ideonella azotifigens]MCD2342025.1 DUF2789 domain-containing protein [Ideonella azotifigens]